jgi:hypothetical protein
MLAAQKDAITRIAGVITPEAIDNLEDINSLIGVCPVLINKAVTYYYKFYTKSPNQCRNLV